MARSIKRYALLALLFVPPRILCAQDTSFFQHIGLDRLQFVSVGASVGRIAPSQVVPTQIYAMSTDYGVKSKCTT